MSDCHVQDETCTSCPRCVGGQFIPTKGMPPCECEGTDCDNPDHRREQRIRDLGRALNHAMYRDHPNEPGCDECANVRAQERRIAQERS